MLKQHEGYKLLKKKLLDLNNEATTAFRSVSSDHPYIVTDSFGFYTEKLKSLNDELSKKIDKRLSDLPDSELIKSSLIDLLDGIVGEAFTQKQLDEIQKVGETRYSLDVPPGFKDKDDNNKKNFRTYGKVKYQQLYGDLILWNQILERASQKKDSKSVIFITEEKKEDWWQKESGQIKRPQPNLIQEFLERTGQKFYMYRTDNFLKFARKYLDASVSEEQVQEVTKEVENIRKVEDIINNQKVVIHKDIINVLFRVALDTLEEGYDINFGKIHETVNQMDDIFTTVDVVRALDDGDYVVGLPINKAMGRILSEGKEIMSIEQLGRINIEDDNNRSTTTQIWKKLE